MKHRLPAVLLLAAFFLLSCTGCAVFGSPAWGSVSIGKKQPQLLFEDTFDGTVLDGTKWERAPQRLRQGTRCMWNDDMSYLDGEGHLVLRAQWNVEAGYVESGAIRSLGRFEGGLGYYEASIRFPAAYGIWGAFWLLVGSMNDGDAAADGSAADGIEIDIIESIRGDENQCCHALHWDGYGEDLQSLSETRFDADIYDNEFHTFGLWRTEYAYIFYIDGEETWRVKPPACDISTEDGYLKLTMEASERRGAGTDASISALPAEMVVDYVRVYSFKPDVE